MLSFVKSFETSSDKLRKLRVIAFNFSRFHILFPSFHFTALQLFLTTSNRMFSFPAFFFCSNFSPKYLPRNFFCSFTKLPENIENISARSPFYENKKYSRSATLAKDFLKQNSFSSLELTPRVRFFK